MCCMSSSFNNSYNIAGVSYINNTACQIRFRDREGGGGGWEKWKKEKQEKHYHWGRGGEGLIREPAGQERTLICKVYTQEVVRTQWFRSEGSYIWYIAITDQQRYHIINANYPTKLHFVYFLPTSFGGCSRTRCSLVFVGLIPPLSLFSFIWQTSIPSMM